jgi:hypothetical protein
VARTAPALAELDAAGARDGDAHQSGDMTVPPRHRRATEEDLAKLPALLISFGPRPVPEEADEDEDE